MSRKAIGIWLLGVAALLAERFALPGTLSIPDKLGEIQIEKIEIEDGPWPCQIRFLLRNASGITFAAGTVHLDIQVSGTTWIEHLATFRDLAPGDVTRLKVNCVGTLDGPNALDAKAKLSNQVYGDTSEMIETRKRELAEKAKADELQEARRQKAATAASELEKRKRTQREAESRRLEAIQRAKEAEADRVAAEERAALLRRAKQKCSELKLRYNQTAIGQIPLGDSDLITSCKAIGIW